MGTRFSPSASRTVTPMASLYLRPSLKMWPASMQRVTLSVPPHVAQDSPATIPLTSSQWSTAMSRATSTPLRCTSSRLAPVVMPVRPSRAGSA